MELTDTSTVPNFTERVANGRQRILGELRKTIVGQDEVVDQVLIALFTGGHCLITGVPGLAKTLLIKTLAEILDLSFKRIQFTPDLMPADITGTEILEEHAGTRSLRFVHGPVFAQIILADEINRTPPKTQAALLEAMQEYHVTAAGRTYQLERPFFVLATQNPIELEGTYPLPEAQLDRFMFNIFLDYPSYGQELDIVKKTTADDPATVKKILAAQDIQYFQHLVRRVPVADNVVEFAVKLTHLTRPGRNGSVTANELLEWGAGPRASQFLVLGAKCNALLNGKYSPDIEDVRAVSSAVLRHRIVRNFKAEADGITVEDIINKLITAL